MTVLLTVDGKPFMHCVTCWYEWTRAGSQGTPRWRPAPHHPGPLCATHHREEVKREQARLARYGCKVCRLLAVKLVNTPVRPVHKAGRCFTHYREFRNAQKARTHERTSVVAYGMVEGDYDKLYEYQRGRCALCNKATGKTKRLAREHRHSDGRLRGLCCGPCNRLIGIFGDDPGRFRAAARYLEDPPAFQLGIYAIHKDKRSATPPEPDQGKYRTNDNTWKA